MKKGNLYADEYKRTIDNIVVIEFLKLARELNINLNESINDESFDQIYIRYVDELIRKKLGLILSLIIFFIRKKLRLILIIIIFFIRKKLKLCKKKEPFFQTILPHYIQFCLCNNFRRSS